MPLRETRGREPTVFVVDDDEAMRDSMRWLIESAGLRVEAFDSAYAFLESCYPGRAGCLVLDVRMPGMSGLELQDKLRKRDIRIPVIIVTGHGDVSMAVAAMKKGATEFIEKPFDDQRLLDHIQAAIEKDRRGRHERLRRSQVLERIGLLTPREVEVMGMVVAGKSNKRIAADLGVSFKTVEAHRARVMEKMQVSSLAELVHMALRSQEPV